MKAPKPHDHAKHVAAAKDIVYAIAPWERLDGAVAWLVRDPGSSPLVVLSRHALSDKLYVVARSVMQRDVVDQPTTNGRRVVKIFHDQSVQIEEAGSIRKTNIRVDVYNVSTTIAPQMLNRYDHGRDLHVDGIGPVRVVFESLK